MRILIADDQANVRSALALLLEQESQFTIIHAWDVMRMLANKQAVSPPLTYLMAPTPADGDGRGPASANGQPPGAQRLTSGANGNGRPATRHGPTPPAPVSAATQNGGGKDTAVSAPRSPVTADTTAVAPPPPGRCHDCPGALRPESRALYPAGVAGKRGRTDAALSRRRGR
jgi:hypothetical protein